MVRRPGRAVVVVLAGAALCAAPVVLAARTTHKSDPQRLRQARAGVRDRVQRAAVRRLGDRFACAVLTSELNLIVQVTDQQALPEANSLIRRYAGRGWASARVVPVRYGWHTMERIRASVTDDMPRKPTSLAISRESSIGRDTCPRVELAILPFGQAGDAVEAWARRAVERYGPDRVSVTRWQGAHQQ